MKSRYSAYPYVIWMVIFTVVPLLLVAAFAITDSSAPIRWKTSLRWGSTPRF